jgi:hypothetical protein
VLDSRLTCDRSYTHAPIVHPNVRQLVNTINVDEMRWLRKTKVHQRNEALASGENTGLITQFSQT